MIADENVNKLTWHGHAAFSLHINGARVLIDPFLSDNQFASINAEEVDADYILITHGHGDHVGDAIRIAQRTGALVISNFEICNWLQSQGVERVHPQHIGGGYTHPSAISNSPSPTTVPAFLTDPTEETQPGCC